MEHRLKQTQMILFILQIRGEHQNSPGRQIYCAILNQPWTLTSDTLVLHYEPKSLLTSPYDV